MSYKLLPRLGSAIGTTILSLFSGVSLVGVDKAQAALLTYTFQAGPSDTSIVDASGFFKVNNSSLTGIDFERIAVSEGRLKTYLTVTKDDYNLAGATALFYQGDFLGLNAGGWDEAIREFGIGEPYYTKYDTRSSWGMENNGPVSLFIGYKEVIITHIGGGGGLVDRSIPPAYSGVSYTLVNTEPEPVPEPLISGGTALALAGLSWLKQKKKMAA
jgi:hypothetical protein